MGERGPAPQRSDTILGHRTKGWADDISRPATEPVVQPDGAPDWNYTQKFVWNSIGKSAVARYYDFSDWAYAYLLIDTIGDYQVSRSPGLLQQVNDMMKNLLMTESERRRSRIEVQFGDPDAETEDDGVEDELAAARARLSKQPS